MSEANQMPPRLFSSGKWDIALRGGRVGMAAWIQCEPFPHEYIRADLVPQWIKCSERLPEEVGYESEDCMCAVELMRGGYIVCITRAIGHYDYKDIGWVVPQLEDSTTKENACYDDYHVTHWQTLPQPPEEV